MPPGIQTSALLNGGAFGRLMPLGVTGGLSCLCCGNTETRRQILAIACSLSAGSTGGIPHH